MERPDRFIVSCTPGPERVAQLRRICAAHLRLWGIGACIETATLLVSELVTNAVRYGETDEITLSVSHWKGEVRIDVRDGAPARPQVRRPDPEEESGRGMLIVEALSEDWGTSQDGTRTWCTVTVPAPVTASAGFWCEWRMADGERLASFASPLPTSAIRWARIQMRIIASAVGQPAIGYLWDWLSDGWREPAEALYQGREFTLPLTAGPYSFVWHARPVRFLPLVGGTPVPHVAGLQDSGPSPEAAHPGRVEDSRDSGGLSDPAPAVRTGGSPDLRRTSRSGGGSHTHEVKG